MSILSFYIDPSRVCIFTKKACSYCSNAINLLKQNNNNPQIIEIDDTNENFFLERELISATGQKTYPFIYINERFIGGYKQLFDIVKSGYFKNIKNTKKMTYQCNICGFITHDKNINCKCFQRDYDDWGAII